MDDLDDKSIYIFAQATATKTPNLQITHYRNSKTEIIQDRSLMASIMVTIVLLAILTIFAVKLFEYFHDMKEGYRVTDYKHMKYLVRMGM